MSDHRDLAGWCERPATHSNPTGIIVFPRSIALYPANLTELGAALTIGALAAHA